MLSGHLHTASAAPFTAAPGLLFVQAGTGLSTRLRGETNNFNLLDVDGPRVSVTTWTAARDDGGTPAFAPGESATYARGRDGWERVGDELAAASGEAGTPQTVLVLPAGGFRSTPLWAGGRVVLDPAPRLLHAAVLAPGDLPVGGRVVQGEGGEARDAQRALLDGANAGELAAMGVDWVLDETTSRGERGRAADTLAGAEQRFADDELTLWRLPCADSSATERPETFAPASDSARRIALAVHAGWALALAGGAAGALIAGRRR